MGPKEKLLAEHLIMLFYLHQPGLVMEVRYRGCQVAAGDGPQCSVLFYLEVLHAAVADVGRPDGCRIIEDRPTDGFVGG